MVDSNDLPGDIRIQQVTRFRDRLRFIALPRQLYRGDPNFVPLLAPMVLAQLNERKNPFFDHARQALFLAERARRPVGRIAAVVDEDLQHRRDQRVGVFGFFECVDDPGVLTALLRAACAWFRQQGVEDLLGPIQHSTNYECGLLVDGFDTPPFVMMTHNPPYYAPLLEGVGFAPAMDLLAYRLHRDNLQRDRVARIGERVLKRSGITIRLLDMRQFNHELESVRAVYNAAWDANWGFVPLSEREFRAQAQEMKRILRPENCVLAEKDGALAGFGLSLPNINEALQKIDGRLFPFGIFRLPGLIRKTRSIRVVTMGVVPEQRASGLEAPLLLAIVDSAHKAGSQVAEMSWVLESNHAMRKAIETLGGSLAKRYRLYEAPLARIERSIGSSGAH